MRVWVVLVCLLIPTISIAAADRVILIFGDSLSTAYGFAVEKSWVSLLKTRLQKKNTDYKVINASISGETTRGGRGRINDVLDAVEPEIVIVELGGNDGLRGINLQTTRRNLEDIVGNSLEVNAKVLLLAMELPPNYGPSYIEQFRSIYTDIAQVNDIHLVPFFLEGVADNTNLMQADGIHPEAQAQPILLDNVWPHLEPLLVH